MASILDGRGQGMPPMRGKISEARVRGLVGYVRSLDRTIAKSGPRQQKGSELVSSTERDRLFEQQMAERRRQYHDLAKASSGRAPSMASESGQHEVTRQLTPSTPGAPTFRELFAQRCVKCHGADGTGNKTRDRLPEIPDFSDTRWQSRRADSNLETSILDGKGDDMPPQRGKISDEQAHGLVRYVRAFAPTKGKSKQEEKESPSQSKPTLPDPPLTPFEERELSAAPTAGAKRVPPGVCKAPRQRRRLRRHLGPLMSRNSSGANV